MKKKIYILLYLITLLIIFFGIIVKFFIRPYDDKERVKGIMAAQYVPTVGSLGTVIEMKQMGMKETMTVMVKFDNDPKQDREWPCKQCEIQDSLTFGVNKRVVCTEITEGVFFIDLF